MRSKQHRSEAVVGITIIVAIAFIIGVLLWSKGNLLPGDVQTLTFRFDSVEGLTKSDIVTLSGVNVGRVTSIRIAGDSVEVRARIDREISLHRDATAAVVSEEIMGGRVIRIAPGTSPEPLPEHAVIHGKYVPGITQLTEVFYSNRQNLETVLADLQVTVSSLRQLMGDTLTQETISSAVQSLKSTAMQVDSFLQDNTTALETSLSNLEQSSGILRKVLTEEEQNLRDLLSGGAAMTASLRTLSDSARIFIHKMNSPNSSLGRLLRDDTLYTKLNNSITTIDSFIKDFQNNPSKYLEDVQFKLRLF